MRRGIILSEKEEDRKTKVSRICDSCCNRDDCIQDAGILCASYKEGLEKDE